MNIIAAIIFIIIALASMIMNLYLNKYPKDFFIHIVLKSILFFNAFFFLMAIPILFGAPIGYLIFGILFSFLLSICVNLTRRFLSQILIKYFGKTKQ